MIGKMLHLARTERIKWKSPVGKKRYVRLRRALNLGRNAMDHWGWE